MKTLKEMVIEHRIRKGAAHGTTKRGAYWCPNENEFFAKLRRAGGDGIGQSAPDVTFWLDLRHFRSGDVRAVICRDSYHQNGSDKEWIDASTILDCTTIEDVVVALKNTSLDGEAVIGADDPLYEALRGWGMPDSIPAPDEEVIE